MPDRCTAFVGEPAAGEAFAPETHAQALQTSAPELAAQLRSEAHRAAVAGFLELDKQADVAQHAYKGEMSRAIRMAIWAAVAAAAATIYAGAIKPTGFLELKYDLAIVRALVMTQVVLLSLGAGIVWRADKAHGYVAWQKKRALAEHARMNLFMRLMDEAMKQPGPDNASFCCEVLAYVRRYLWFSQVDYYLRRASQHAAEVKGRERRRRRLSAFSQTVKWVGVAIGVATLAFLFVPGNSALAVFHTDMWGIEAVIGGAGIVASALVAARQSGEYVHRDEVNALRYKETVEELTAHGGETWDMHAKPFEEAWEAASLGEASKAQAWTRRLVSILAGEHRGWLSAQSAARQLRDAIGRIPKGVV